MIEPFIKSNFFFKLKIMKKKVQVNQNHLWWVFRKSGCLYTHTFVSTLIHYEGGRVKASSLCLRAISSLSWVEAIVKELSGWTSMTTCESKTPLIDFS